MHNVLLNNHAGGGGDAGGIYAEYSSHPVIEGNTFVGNSADDDGAAAYFMAAARPTMRGNILVGNGPGGGVIRLSKNGLGYFEGNRIFGNPTDAILCRDASAVTVNNVICENAADGIFARGSVLTSRNDTICGQEGVGMRANLGSPRVVNSLIAGNAGGQLRLDAPAIWVRHCLLAGKTAAEPAGRKALQTNATSNLDRIIVQNGMPRFRANGFTSTVQIVGYNPDQAATELRLTADPAAAGSLAGRPVRIGEQWTVCRAAGGRSISVWSQVGEEGSIPAAVACYFPRTYHLDAESPGVDDGDLLGAPAVDFEGESRPTCPRAAEQVDHVDIGADEVSAHPGKLSAESEP